MQAHFKKSNDSKTISAPAYSTSPPFQEDLQTISLVFEKLEGVKD